MKYFYEENTPGYKIGVEIKKKLYSKKINNQKIEVFNINKNNNLLVIDGEIKFSSGNEFVYSEIMAHYPLFSHPNPERVLILGGGDGSILKEVLKHKRVEEVYLIEENEELFNISKDFFSEFEFEKNEKSKKLKISSEKRIEFLNKFEDYFDIIILDSKEKESSIFYKTIKNTLNKDGIFIQRMGNYVFNKENIKKIKSEINSLFDHMELIKSVSFLEDFYILASKRVNINEINSRIITIRFKQFLGRTKLKYFSPEIYMLSKYLPRFQQQEFK